MLTTGSSLSLCRITRELGGVQFTVSRASLVHQPYFCREGKIRLGTPAQYYAQAGMLDCVMACNKLTAITNFRYAKRVYTYNNVLYMLVYNF